MWGSGGAYAGGCGAGGEGGDGGDRESLVAQVKELQRNNVAAKEQWISYTTKNGGGHRDPNRHTAEFLQSFLVQLSSEASNPAGNDRFTGDGSIETLVAQVKEIQRTDPIAKEQWIAYTDTQGQGHRDPNRHSAEFLEAFLVQLNSGKTFTMNNGPSTLGDAIKTMQKRSVHFKTAWAHFCSIHGQGKNDPAKHDSSYHGRFFDHLAQSATMSMGTSPMMNVFGEPPMKRMRTGPSMGGGGGMKEALVLQVKAFQRMGQEQKELWHAYADQYLSGVRDPSRHEAATLHEFCVNHGVPEVDGGFAMGGGGGASSLKQGLVERVKAFQKASKENYEVWGAFCGDTRDPNRHEVAKLQEFCQMYDI